MFRVLLVESQADKIYRQTDLTMKTEKLYELIGRYTLKYGVPDVVLDNEEGLFEYEFVTYDSEHVKYEAKVSFARISKGKKPELVPLDRKVPVVVVPPAPPKPSAIEEGPPEERLQAMLEAGVLTKGA